MATSGRLDYVESIRGLACLMLVAFHVTGATSLEGLRLGDAHPLRLLNEALENTRMPVFAFISGFVLHAAIMSMGTLKKSLWSKARRLLIPMATVGALHYMLRSLSGVEQGQPFYSIFFVQYAHFWFLQAGFILNSVLLILSYRLDGNSRRAALILLVVVTPVFISATRWNPNIFSVYQGLYLAPFFFSGHLFCRYLKDRETAGDGLLPSWLTYVVGAAFVASLAWSVLAYTGVVELERPFTNIFRVAAGLASALFLFLLKPNAKWLVWVGTYTYTIYLFHVMIAASFRGVLTRLLPDIDHAWFFVPCFLAGLFGPVLLQHLLLKNGVTAMLFLGIDLKRRLPASPPKAVQGFPQS